MARSAGEMNVINDFQKRINSRILKKYPQKVDLVESNMSGKDDTTFSDYFVSIDSNNILIEFKEYEKGIKRECEKPLRNLLCEKINKYKIISCKGHKIAWGNYPNSNDIIFDSYISKVCPFCKININCSQSKELNSNNFIVKFLSGSVGLKLKEMIEYLRFLQSLTEKGIPSDGRIFQAKLYSYYEGALLENEITQNDFLNLIKIIEDNSNNISKSNGTNKPKNDNSFPQR